jgi:hypothetical protein
MQQQQQQLRLVAAGRFIPRSQKVRVTLQLSLNHKHITAAAQMCSKTSATDRNHWQPLVAEMLPSVKMLPTQAVQAHHHLSAVLQNASLSTVYLLLCRSESCALFPAAPTSTYVMHCVRCSLPSWQVAVTGSRERQCLLCHCIRPRRPWC